MSIIYQSFFWSDSRYKNIDLFFNKLNQLRQERNSQYYKIDTNIKRKPIPSSCVILVEGIDGSGKDTFTTYLVEFLKNLSIRTSNSSISVVGFPSSISAYGQICKDFIENAHIQYSYNEIKYYLEENRKDFLQNLNSSYQGVKIFVRGILTEEATLCRLYPDYNNRSQEELFKDIDFFILVNADVDSARKRIKLRGIKETWRESRSNLQYFSDFFNEKVKYCPNYMIVSNREENSLDDIRSQAYEAALYIFNKFYF